MAHELMLSHLQHLTLLEAQFQTSKSSAQMCVGL